MCHRIHVAPQDATWNIVGQEEQGGVTVKKERYPLCSPLRPLKTKEQSIGRQLRPHAAARRKNKCYRYQMHMLQIRTTLEGARAFLPR